MELKAYKGKIVNIIGFGRNDFAGVIDEGPHGEGWIRIYDPCLVIPEQDGSGVRLVKMGEGLPARGRPGEAVEDRSPWHGGSGGDRETKILNSAGEDSIMETKLELHEDLENRFTYHAPKPGQPERYEKIRKEAKNLAIYIADECPNSREKSLALTKLEEAVFWANAAIARHE